MILERWINKRTNTAYRRITKGNAKKLFVYGHVLIIAPVKANLDSPWHTWSIMQYNGKDDSTPEQSFDRIINSFTYYNCNPQIGLYPKFYIPESIYYRYFG